jgi:putative ABC transport system permease protein
MAESVTIQNFIGDDNYIPTLGMRLIAGRNFSRELASDSSAAIINEAAARVLLLGDDPIGKEINEGETVIGVVSDFNFQSLKQHIEPVVLTYAETGDELAVKLRGSSVAGFVDRLTAIWQQFAPDTQLRYAFLDDQFAELAAKERILGKTVSFFTLFAILIAAMGLFGLAAFTAARRTKEIGVRKVLGASVPNLAALLTKDFLVLVSIAFALAAPVAYLAMQRWLSDFAYHVEIGVGVFVFAGVAAAIVAVATVSYQAIRAAMADPVKSLRYE